MGTGDRTSNLDLQGFRRGQENANQEQRAEMLAPSRWAPPAAGQVWEISASTEAPEGTSLVAT